MNNTESKIVEKEKIVAEKLMVDLQ